MSLFEELKRRNVFRVATAYAVVGWLILQIADVVLEFAEAPAWIGKTLIALLLIGFLVAVVLSWLLEVTPEGIRRDDGSVAPDPVRAQRLNILTVAAALGVAGMFLWQQLAGPSRDAAPAMAVAVESATASSGESEEVAVSAASIAVLPFADLSQSGEEDYFSDGISEEILNVLANVEGLAVASRTSAFAFKGREAMGIPAIAAELGVRHVLEGSVRTAGDTIRITAQLIDARSDKHLWSQTFDKQRTAENVFEIQDEIASAIVAALSESLQLQGLENKAVTVRADTSNLDAYELFLLGRQRFRQRGVDNIEGTIEIFQRAIALDPEFARAWAGLSAIAAVAPSWGFPGESESNYARANRAAQRAIELDDSLALPYAVMAYTNREDSPLDFAHAFRMYDEAFKRDPDEVNTLLWRGIDLTAVGQFERASADFRRCRELDPNYLNCWAFDVNAHLFAGDLDGAMKLYVETAGLHNPSQSIMMALALSRRGDRNTAMLALAWSLSAFDIQSLRPERVYRLVTQADLDRERELADLNGERRLLNLPPLDLERDGALLALLFGRYDLMKPVVFGMYWWHPAFPEFLQSPHRKRLIREVGIYDYWRKEGFPPHCRPVGDDDFECDDAAL